MFNVWSYCNREAIRTYDFWHYRYLIFGHSPIYYQLFIDSKLLSCSSVPNFFWTLNYVKLKTCRVLKSFWFSRHLNAINNPCFDHVDYNFCWFMIWEINKSQRSAKRLPYLRKHYELLLSLTLSCISTFWALFPNMAQCFPPSAHFCKLTELDIGNRTQSHFIRFHFHLYIDYITWHHLPMILIFRWHS